jgi:ribosome-binding protein aMBF1 (putative translation factor)
MDFGSRIAVLRKVKDWPQSPLAKNIEVSREIGVRYERNNATPFIDVAKKMGNASDASLDYLVGNAQNRRLIK